MRASTRFLLFLLAAGAGLAGAAWHASAEQARRADAAEFLKDHHGTRILGFDDVTLDLVRSLDK